MQTRGQAETFCGQASRRTLSDTQAGEHADMAVRRACKERPVYNTGVHDSFSLKFQIGGITVNKYFEADIGCSFVE